MQENKKTVCVIVSADIWGNRNANRLLPKLKEQDCNIILIIGRATPDAIDGMPANKRIPALRPLWAIKQNAFLSFCDAVDTTATLGGKTADTEMLSFQRLAREYCLDGKLHSSSCGGSTGGKEIESVIEKYATAGHKPDLILSGDVIALLPKSLVDNYDCFGTHPGPLPGNGGMHCSERSEIFQRLYNSHGGVWTTNTDGPFIWGSFFKLASELDKGPVIDFAHTPCANPFYRCQDIDLFMQRLHLYDALISRMIDYLPRLLDPAARKQLVDQRIENPLAANRALLHWHDVPELEPDHLREWLELGRRRDDNHNVREERRFIFKPESMRELFFGSYWPKDWGKEGFNLLYDAVVKPYLPLTAKKATLVVPGTASFAEIWATEISTRGGLNLDQTADFALDVPERFLLGACKQPYVPTGELRYIIRELRLGSVCTALRFFDRAMHGIEESDADYNDQSTSTPTPESRGRSDGR